MAGAAGACAGVRGCVPVGGAGGPSPLAKSGDGLQHKLSMGLSRAAGVIALAAAFLPVDSSLTAHQARQPLPDELRGRCPAFLGQPPPLEVRTGGGPMEDSGLPGLTEVMWVGPECLGVFAGSPAVLKLDGSGGWLFAHDFFGASIRTRGINNTVQVFHSADNGETWSYRSNVTSIYWANLFSVNGDIYLLGTHGDDFHIVSPPNTKPMKGGPVTISKSTDQGQSFGPPAVILQGSYQTGPCPVISVNGTLYRTMEDSSVGVGALLMWADESADLLSPASWSHSASLVAPSAPGGKHVDWQEGSAVESPSGEVWNVLRVNGQSVGWHNKAAIAVLDQQLHKLRFKQWVDGPFGTSKFVVRRDPESDRSTGASPRYFAVSTNVTAQAVALGAIGARNNLVLSTSVDLLQWKVCTTLLRDNTGFSPADSAKYTGFEYPDWQFDGPADMLVGIRTAYRGAAGAGSSNRMTSLRVQNFRDLC